MRPLKNSELNNFTYSNIHTETKSVTIYSSLNFSFVHGMYIHIHYKSALLFD